MCSNKKDNGNNGIKSILLSTFVTFKHVCMLIWLRQNQRFLAYVWVWLCWYKSLNIIILTVLWHVFIVVISDGSSSSSSSSSHSFSTDFGCCTEPTRKAKRCWVKQTSMMCFWLLRHLFCFGNFLDSSFVSLWTSVRPNDTMKDEREWVETTCIKRIRSISSSSFAWKLNSYILAAFSWVNPPRILHLHQFLLLLVSFEFLQKAYIMDFWFLFLLWKSNPYMLEQINSQFKCPLKTYIYKW